MTLSEAVFKSYAKLSFPINEIKADVGLIEKLPNSDAL